ncbi:DUF4012 domain-containing protein [Microbacterium sediminicola]|uniref:DUF4012 domain-containing protein n=1 Tax=Microbacterium sediminicola TaxID=415210 RepID=A0ABN2ILG7_9MICO
MQDEQHDAAGDDAVGEDVTDGYVVSRASRRRANDATSVAVSAPGTDETPSDDDIAKEAGRAARTARRERKRQDRRRARVIGIVVGSTLGAFLLIGVAGLAWIGVRGAQAAEHVTEAKATAATITDALSDPTAMATITPDLIADTSAARELTSDPIWRAYEALPWLGPQLEATATTIAAVDDVVQDALVPLTDAATGFSLDTLRPSGGAFDVEAIASLKGVAQIATDSLAAAQASVEAIDTSQLIGAIAAPVNEVSDLLATGYTAADALLRTSQLMPAFLGVDGPRDYLVMFQNNAEWRSLGGIIGAMAMIHTDAGTIDLVGQGSSSDFTRYPEPVLPLSDEILSIYVDKPGLYIQNVTQIPDYTIDGPLAQEMWRLETGTTVDGVLALDPVTLSYLLEATGPITLPTGEQLTAENAVTLLLNEVYERYPEPRDQDAFFAITAATVFDAIADGAADPTKLIDALARAGSERRLFIWSANLDEQAVLDGSTIQGALPVSDARTTRFGAYLNDGTGSKMDYYVTADAAVGWCPFGIDQVATMTVTLTNTAPDDAATSLPEYITGGGNHGVPPGVARTVAYLYLPPGSELVSSTTSGVGTAPGFGTNTHDGYTVLTWDTDLSPGDSATATVQVRLTQTPHLEIEMTPTIGGSGVVTAAGCPTP